MTNRQRAKAAAAAIKAHQRAINGKNSRPDKSDLWKQSDLRDLLTDLRHYSDKIGARFAEQDRLAHRNYLAEIAGTLEVQVQWKGSLM